MERVSDKLHLQKRGNVWHYYRRVPKDLVPVLGKRFIKYSLKVASLSEAKRLRTLADIKTDALFASAEKALSGNGRPADVLAPKDFSVDMLTEYVRETIERLDKRNAEQLSLDPPESRDQREEICMNTEIGLQILSNPSDPRRDEWVDGLSKRILAEAGVEVEVGSADYVRFSEIVRRGLVELNRRKLDRYNDRFDVPFHDSLFDPSRPPAVTFAELAKTYLKEKEEEYELNGVSLKRVDKVRAAVATIREIVGDSLPVHAIDDDIVQKVRSTLARLPANRVKLYPRLSIPVAIERAARQNKPVLAPITQRVYLDVFRDLLKVAVRKKLLPNNPAADVRPLKKDPVPLEEKRLPWTKEQLKGFFEGKFYRSCAPGGKGYSKPDWAWRFWLPLIMLFTGARPNEIAQLEIGDVKQTVAGTWYLDLTNGEDEDGGKRLKTASSRRRIPVHSELIRIGFLQFVVKRKKEGVSQRLFHELTPDKYGNLATYATRRFNERFIGEEIELGPRQSLYSLRHNVRDALRRVHAPEETLLAVTGWSPSGKAVSYQYGDPGNPDHHISWVAKIAYDGLDLSFLHVPKSCSI